MDSDQACLQCHKEMTARLTSHTHHDADSAGSRCYNCHMPHTTFGLLHAMRSHQVSSPNVRESLDYGRPNACNLCHLNETLSWTADKLHAWYQQPVPELSDDDKTISAAVQWLVKGDAGQRALLAWGMGWEPAQKISGRDWLYPYLIYSSARSLCRRPLRRLEIVADSARFFGFQIHLHRGRRSARRGGETKL